MTPRQWQIVELVGEGLKNREIGKMLGVGAEGGLR